MNDMKKMNARAFIVFSIVLLIVGICLVVVGIYFASPAVYVGVLVLISSLMTYCIGANQLRIIQSGTQATIGLNGYQIVAHICFFLMVLLLAVGALFYMKMLLPTLIGPQPVPGGPGLR